MTLNLRTGVWSAYFCLAWAVAGALGGCASAGKVLEQAGSAVGLGSDATASTAVVSPAATRGTKLVPDRGFFLPATAFASAAAASTAPKSTGTAKLTPAPKPVLTSTDKPTPFISQALVYSSPSTRAFLQQGGMDASASVAVWEGFLKKYRLAYRVINSPDQIESAPSGALILPSSVALSARERKAIVDFRGRGGSVLATYLCGVRDERGAWLGFDFMEQALDVSVLGTTEPDKVDAFMMVYGDNPVAHNLPAGQRVWLERVNNWFPLRIQAKNLGADLMEWSRAFTQGKPTGAVAFDERSLGDKRTSRVAAYAYPERSWQSADPAQLEALAHSTVNWLMRRPTAYVAAWPAPYKSAAVFSIDAGDPMTAVDAVLAKKLKDAGIPSTFFVLGEGMRKGVPHLKATQALGHEMAYMGDKFELFRGQPLERQSARLAAMFAEAKAVGLDFGPPTGMHAPVATIDRITARLLHEQGFQYYIASMEVSDARLPLIPPKQPESTGTGPLPVVLPRTQRGPEDATEEGDIDEGLQSYYDELTLAQKMGGLSFIRQPNGGLLTPENMDDVVENLKSRSAEMWLARGIDVANWWRERVRVKASLAGPRVNPVLAVDVEGSTALSKPVAVWVNLPESGGGIELRQNNQLDGRVKLVRIDAWRMAVTLEKLPAGRHEWDVTFTPP